MRNEEPGNQPIYPGYLVVIKGLGYQAVIALRLLMAQDATWRGEAHRVGVAVET